MDTVMDTQWIDVNLIDLPEYGRMHSPEAVEALASDMVKNGQLQNAVVCKKEGGRFELLIGKGRLEAARKLGWEKIRADVKDGLGQVQKLAMMAAENEAREDASPFYTAMLYNEMMTAGNLTQQQLADQIGRTQTTVSSFATLATVPKEIWMAHQPELTSMRLCMEIAKAKDPEHQRKLVEAATKDGLGTAALKKLAKKLKDGAPAAGDSAGDNPETPAFAFSWKGNAIVLKPRPYQPHAQAFRVYLNELEEAYERFMATQTATAA